VTITGLPKTAVCSMYEPAMAVKKLLPRTGGAPGSTLTITDKHLDEAVKVVVDGAVATVSSQTATQLTVTVHQNAQTAFVTVVSAIGAAISSKQFPIT
jgi:hypothetical protein